jgi:hypothetical protein
VTAIGSLGLTVLVLFISLGVIAYFLEGRFPVSRRGIQAYREMKASVGESIESGQRVHLALGTGPVTSIDGGASLAGLATLARLAALTSVADLPTIASAGDGTLMLLAEATLRSAYRERITSHDYEPLNARMLATTPFSYVAAMPTLIEAESVCSHLIFGSYRMEVGLAAAFGRAKGAAVVGGTDDVLAQSLLFATADHAVIGEEFYAAPAYLEGGKAQQAGLRTQDSIRILVILAILIGTLLKTLGVIQ